MLNPKVYIIILNYNGWEDTIECLESVLKSEYDNYQIIVVDNNSPNNSIDYLIKWAKGKISLWLPDNNSLKFISFPLEKKPLDYILYTKKEAMNGGNKEKEDKLKNPIIFIQAGENKGFAAGNNIGIKYALVKNDFDYIWLLNNDTIIKKDTLKNLVKYANDNNIGICGSVLKYYDDPNSIQAYGGTVNKFFGTSKHILNKNEIENKLNYIVGASFLINKKVINKIGLLPEEYFLYYEETDYCFNAKNNNFKLGIALDSIVYHKEGSSAGSSADPKERSAFSDILTLRNRIKFHKKYLGGGIGLWIGMMIAFFNRVKRGQIDRIWNLLKNFNKEI